MDDIKGFNFRRSMSLILLVSKQPKSARADLKCKSTSFN